MPWTPWRSTSSATRNASTIEVLRSSTVSSRLLGTTISVSTSSASAAIPASACTRRREPSNWNGRVTIPTVSAPSSRAIWATTGAAPVPVPPPAPAAMKTMSDPRSSALMRSYSSRAACRPRSGFEPEPRPRVTESPMCRVSWAADCCSDCRSVLIAMNSTPAIWASTIRLTALTPAPPTPTTVRTGPAVRLDSSACGLAYTSGSGGSAGSSGAAITFSGMSAEKAWRNRSWGDGMRRSGSSGGGAEAAPEPAGPGLRPLDAVGSSPPRRRPLGRLGCLLGVCAVGSLQADRAVRCPRPSCGIGPRAVPRACSHAYRLAFERTSFASCL